MLLLSQTYLLGCGPRDVISTSEKKSRWKWRPEWYDCWLAGGQGPLGGKYRQLLEAGRGREQTLPWSFQKECGSVLISA